MKTVSVRMSNQQYKKIDDLRKSNMYPKHLEEQTDSQIIRDCISVAHWEYCLHNKSTEENTSTQTDV